AEDVVLRREVERLLAANEQAGGFLAAPALELEAREMAAALPLAALAIHVGQELSHYTVLARLGAGGMGEVFLAQDRILERRVALKLLPTQFTQDAERLQRFLREAKAASALNHPNIMTIYETGDVSAPMGQTQFIATEFIEGETLRNWKPDEEQRQRQALNVGIQVASALGAAHQAGIVHRDIKPENIMVRPDGLVKVLDFGLAKLTPTGDVDHEAGTLIKSLHTQPGMILGTLRYMSPEQARGRGVDARSDLFSLGVVLYELFTGQPLFTGDTDADVVAAIIHQQAPPLAAQLADVPAELERIVQKALAKDKEQRYQDARDLQVDLQALKQEGEFSARLKRPEATNNFVAQATGAMSAPRFSLRQVLMGLAAALLIAGAIGWLLLKRGGPSEAAPVSPARTVEVVSWRGAPGEVYSLGSLSPDARRVAYSSTESGTQNIWVKSTLSGNSLQITTDGSLNDYPIWSPDGEEIAFFSVRGNHTGIWRIPYFGGTPKEIASLDIGDVSLRLWASGAAHSTIYFMSKRNLFALDVEAKQVNQVTHFDASTQDISAISISPDEQRIAYASRDDKGGGSLWFMPASGATAVQVASDPAEIRNPVWHPDGQRILYSARVDGIYQIFAAYVDSHKVAQITFNDTDSFVLDVSADGTRVLFGSSKEESDLWGVSVERAEEFAFAADIGCELWPDVSSDGRTVAYQSVRNLSQGDKLFDCAILTKSTDPRAPPSQLTAPGCLPTWSPDGRQLGFVRVSGQTYNLWTMRATGGG
ncbi:MAG TPA: protein kinase, partial [Blastocatellia bacterium]